VRIPVFLSAWNRLWTNTQDDGCQKRARLFPAERRVTTETTAGPYVSGQTRSEGQAVRIVPCVIVVALVSLNLTGCSVFNKRPANGDRAAAPNDALPFKPPEPQPVSGRGPSDAELGGLLAGRVIDRANNRPAEAFIRWVCLEDKEEETPVDVAVSAEGYFTIQGLKRGKHYKLIARARSGDRTLAGVTYTEAPNVRVLITVSEEFATQSTPPLPGAPAYPAPGGGPKKAAKKPAESPASAAAPGWQPGNDGLPPPSIGTPRPMAESGPPAAPFARERIAQGDEGPKAPAAPLANIPPAPPMGVSPAWQPDVAPPPMANQTVAPAPVPSCVLVGNQLVNFALRDVFGEPWEWKRQRRGKLVLLDFWSTTCTPCIQTVPHLHILQDKFGWAGLEVVAIACEKGSTPDEKANKVKGLCSRLQTNYRLLLDGGSDCPVRRGFAVQYFPTLVLVDENGWIVWRHEGLLSRNELDDLELRIKRRLGVR
jgi:thiol-disulfide isomerase/thioredoxin